MISKIEKKKKIYGKNEVIDDTETIGAASERLVWKKTPFCIGPKEKIKDGKYWHRKKINDKYVKIEYEALERLGLKKEILSPSFFNGPKKCAEYSKLHLTVNSCEFSPAFHKFLKFAFYLSSSFIFHIKYDFIESFQQGGYGIIQSLFIIGIINAYEIEEKNRLNGTHKSFAFPSISVMVHDRHPGFKFGKNFNNKYDRYIEVVENMIAKAWNKAIEYLEPHINISDLKLDFSLINLRVLHLFQFSSPAPFAAGKHKQKNLKLSKKYFFKGKQIEIIRICKKRYIRKANSDRSGSNLTTKSLDRFIANACKKAEFIDFFITGEDLFPAKYWTKSLISTYLIEAIFDSLYLGLISLIKRWYAITDKRLYISNFGLLFKKIKNRLFYTRDYVQKQLETFQNNIEEGTFGSYCTKENWDAIDEYTEKAQLLLEHHTKRIWVLQMKKLQYSCSDFFEKKILKSLSKNPSEFDKLKERFLLETEKIFQKTVKGHDIPALNKLVMNAVLELRKVLNQYTEKCKEIPVTELRDINRISKDIRSRGVKQRVLLAGIAINASVRLRGYGNFQIITSYGIGPHLLNFTCINDRDTMENDLKEKISPFRIQPTVNLDIKI